MMDARRRRLLQGAIAAIGSGSLARWGAAGAQADRNLGLAPRAAPAPPPSAGTLLVAKRRALVIGNSTYGFAPLRNPANDARAISGALRATGFQVTTAVDFSREQMAAAIRAYTEALAAEKAVGLFYFAGHGVQLAWRNYLLPTDAKVQRMEEIQQTCVDVNSLIDGISKAANPMNVVILDACRENPFGADFRVEQKGLSQLDAPPGTLLAFATSPGNVASDGAGENGLYTENLLKEIRVPEAKIEDVFKRVRLAVRLRSNGLQIPWESTSLESDFWFIPPKDLKRRAEAEREREFSRQRELWERTQAAEQARQRELIASYLQQYPNGFFAELAELQLDRIGAQQGEQRIQVVSSAQNPYAQGTARADIRFKVGDSYTYNNLEFHSRRLERSFTQSVTQVTADKVIYGNGGMATDLLGNPVYNAQARRQFTPNQQVPLEFAVGRRWSTRYMVTHPDTSEFLVDLDYRIVGKERITVPAGTFECFVVQARGTSFGRGNERGISQTRWFAPEKCRRAIKIAHQEQFRGSGRDTNSFHEELVHFRQT